MANERFAWAKEEDSVWRMWFRIPLWTFNGE